MSLFYILNDITPIEANSAKDAARKHALNESITAGQVTVSTASKVFDVTEIPRNIEATEV